jgi:hypothetical protein
MTKDQLSPAIPDRLRLRRTALWIAVVALAAAIRGQTIDSYQNPPGICWKQIETLHFQIVFPRELSEDALRVADTMEHLVGPLSRSLEANRRPFRLFLTNQGVVANGFVTLAPRKSVWFHQPMQGTFTGSGEWYGLLAAHEGRHMVQFDKVNTGFTRFAGWLAGEAGILGLSMFSIPLWWWEGDAVSMETALTRCGRGRIPEFGMGLRTQLMHDIRYSYSKAYLGSYRDWTPDWYELGYPLISHVRQGYGPSAWSRVIRRTSRWSFWPFSFSNALKKETGKSLSRMYEETLSELSAAWRKRITGPSFPEHRILNPNPPVWTNYRFPQYLNDTTVVAQKWGLDIPWTLVALDLNGNEKTLKQISPLEPGGTKGSAAAGKIIWDEAIPDSRWGAKTLPCIAVFDIRTGKTRRMSRENRFFNPSLSPDGERIAAVEFGTDRKCGLVILDAGTGRLIRRIPSPDNALIQAPSWSADGRQIVFTSQGNRGKGVSICDIGTGEIREAIPPGVVGISHPVLFDRWVLFSSPKSGIDNIHAVDLETGIEYQATSMPAGAFSPQVSPDGKRMLFSCYSLKGMGVCEADFDPSQWIRPDSSTADAAGYAETLTAQEGGPVPDESAVPKTVYPVRDYKLFSHLLNVHSWFPVSGSHEWGLLFRSNDGLNTLSLAFGPVFDTNEDRVRLEAVGAYAGWFPIVDFGVSRGGRAAKYRDEQGRRWTDSWTETSASLGMSVPLDLSRGVYYTQFKAGLAASFTAVTEKSIALRYDNFNGNLVPFVYRLEFSCFRETAIRDLAPRWGQFARIGYRHTPFKSDYRGSQLFSLAVLYFPGFMKHHHLMFRAAWEEQRPDNYLFSTSFPFSRGYDSMFHERLAYASASYAFPVSYPDLAVGSITYLKRVTGKLFYDYTLGKDGDTEMPYRSTGAEIGFETFFFNLEFPFDIRVRWVRRIEDNENRIEAAVNMNM